MTGKALRRYEKARKAYFTFMKFYPFTLDSLDGEEWKDIDGYEGLYQVSTFGRIKSFHSGKGKIFTPKLCSDGYLFVNLSKNGQKKMLKVHRLVAQTFTPNPDNKPQVNHIDGHKFNNYVDNLEWSTNKENMKHASKTKLVKSGEENPAAKLTNKDILYIRTNTDNLTTVDLAKIFAVTKTTISRIQLGRRYGDVGGVLRGKKKGGSPRTPDSIREKIRSEYVFGSRESGANALAKKYGLGRITVLRILHEK